MFTIFMNNVSVITASALMVDWVCYGIEECNLNYFCHKRKFAALIKCRTYRQISVKVSNSGQLQSKLSLQL